MTGATALGVRERRLRAWVSGQQHTAFAETVAYGQLADGRFWADRSGEAGGAYVFAATEPGSTLALRLAYRWRRESGQRWQSIQAYLAA